MRAQVSSYLEWRAGGFAKLAAADVATEAATGKARLLAERDLVRQHWSAAFAAVFDVLCALSSGGQSCWLKLH